MPRLIYNPVEESLKSYFSLHPTDSVVLSRAIKASLLLGGAVVAFGPWYCSLLVKLIAPKWASESVTCLFQIYCIYVAIMGVNGVVEGFIQSTAPPTVLNVQSGMMVVNFSVYLLVSYSIGGSVGLVVGNCVNSLMRIAFGLWYLQRVHHAMPRINTVFAYAACSGSAAASWVHYGDSLIHFSIGVGLVGGLAFITWYFEAEGFRDKAVDNKERKKDQ